MFSTDFSNRHIIENSYWKFKKIVVGIIQVLSDPFVHSSFSQASRKEHLFTIVCG